MRFPALLLALAVVCGTAPAAAEGDDPVGRAAAVQGLVEVHRVAAARPLERGADLFAADRIVTGADGRARLAMNDGSEITVGADTELQVASYVRESGGAAAAVWDLVEGILRATLPEAGGAAPLDVETGVAVASARSTVFIVEAEPGRTAVLSVEGRVEVASKDGAIGAALAPGFGMDFEAGEPAKGPRQWPGERVQSFLERTTLR